MVSDIRLPVTVLVAAKNEEVNIARCLKALEPAERVIVLDSHSTDNTEKISRALGAEVVQFDYKGGYPKKRQWALDNVEISTPWVFLLDADEVVPPELWEEIATEVARDQGPDAYMIVKGFHFLGKRFRFGGFSFSAVLLFRVGKAKFERLIDDLGTGLDMEVHERVLVEGEVGRLSHPLIHEDFKGLEAYLDRHNRYSTWESRLRLSYIESGRYGSDTIRPNLFGNPQERRRFLKAIIMRIPLESWVWFLYHYVVRLGFLEGRRGLIAAQIRAGYISQVRQKIYEMRLKQKGV